MSVNISGKHLEFDSNGNPNIGYKMIEWVWNGSEVNFINVGSFHDQQLTINKTLFKWHTDNSEVISTSY